MQNPKANKYLGYDGKWNIHASERVRQSRIMEKEVKKASKLPDDRTELQKIFAKS